MNKKHSRLLIMNDFINTFNRTYRFFKMDKGNQIKKRDRLVTTSFNQLWHLILK